MRQNTDKKRLVVILQLFIAGLFVTGAGWAGEPVHRFFHNYFADIAIPFSFYFLLVLVEDSFRHLRKWKWKAAVIFLLCSLSETLQYFGIYALARVFDPLDYLMYALGTGLAVFVDRIVFPRVFRFWQ